MPSIPFRAVLFDFDGVLVDSEPVRFAAGQQALAEVGVALDWERFVRHWLGRTDRAGLGEILGERYEADGPGVAARRNALYEARLDEVPAFPDALGLLERLPAGLRTAVATGSRRPEVDRILARLGILPRFQALVTAEDYARAKPAPDPFLAAADRLAVEPAACLVVEDTGAGVAAALAAGMPVVAVDRGRGAAGLAQADWTVAGLDAVRIDPAGTLEIGPGGNPGRR